MTSALKRSILGLALLLTPLTSWAEKRAEPDPLGAVMCHWMIYSSILRFAETCRLAEDVTFVQALTENVYRIEKFILRNSDMTAADLAAFARKATVVDDQLCFPDSDGARLYNGVKDRASEMEERVSQLLAVERPPVWEPCL